MATIKLELNEKQHGGFNLYKNDIKIGEMAVSIANGALTVYHTEVDEAFSGQGLAKNLLDEMVAYVRKNDLEVIPLCPYVFAQFKRHPDTYADIWKKD